MSVEESGSHPLLDFRGMGALRLRYRMIERFQQVIHRDAYAARPKD